MGRASKFKKMRRAASEMAQAANLPERLIDGGAHRFVMREVPVANGDGTFGPETEQKLFFVPSLVRNNEMSARGLYRSIKRSEWSKA